MNGYEYTTVIHGWPVGVDKDGGGTVGKAYDGTWSVTVMNGPALVFDGVSLHTGTPKTHAEAACLAYEFACAQEEETL